MQNETWEKEFFLGILLRYPVFGFREFTLDFQDNEYTSGSSLSSLCKKGTQIVSLD